MSIRIPGPASVAALACLLAGLWPPGASAGPDLWKAVREDDLAGVERILSEGVTARARNAALFHAVSGGMAEALLAAGADPDARIRDDGSAVHWAARRGDDGILRALVAAGADVNAPMSSVYARNDRRTALHLAAGARRRGPTLQTARLLVAAGADVNARTFPCGATPLHDAAGRGRDPAVIDLLLEAGADPLARLAASRACERGRNDGATPFDLARKHNPRILRTDPGRRLEEATRRAGMGVDGCDGVVVQPSDTKLSWLAARTLGRASRWREIAELNGLEGRGCRAGDCLRLPGRPFGPRSGQPRGKGER